MRRSLVAGNWKMHGSRQMASELLTALSQELGSGLNGVDIAVCPPAILLPEAEKRLRRSELLLGAQNAWHEDSGAFTGETSPAMLAESSVRFVITGHSERRQLFGETNGLVAAKFQALQRHGMIPILCVGETLEQREAGATMQVVQDQLDAVLESGGPGAFVDAVVAYEPVWAIGTGRAASPDQAQEVHAFIRAYLAAKDEEVARRLRIIYGGSVKSGTAGELFAQSDIDGGLIGGASLDAQEFIKICKSVS